MLALFETSAGFALFKVLDERKLNSVEDIWKEFETPDAARKAVKLKAFQKFANTAEALGAATAIVDSKLSKGLKKFLKKEVQGETLAIADSKLGKIVSDKLSINCIYNSAILELMRGIRSQLAELISGLAGQDLGAMSLGLSHSLSRYKLKFSPDKVDTMIVQAIGLLDDLDKELNTYAMRVREWYGWHFPELGKIVQDNIKYAKVVNLMGIRERVGEIDFSGILEEEVEAEMKEAANVSMGTEVSDQDMLSIKALCDQVIALAEYRGQLYDYLRARMNTIAPNLTVMVGELVGARLIAHAGSLISLAKQPASTLQILGAEKALFRALKSKRNTPKYGLIYNCSLIGQAPAKFKGKIARILAAKSALSTRLDALGDDANPTIALEDRVKLEARLRNLEGRALKKLSGVSTANSKTEAYDKDRKKGAPGLITAAKSYNPATDSTLGLPQPLETASGQEKKRKKKPEAEEPAAAPVTAIERAPEEPPKKKKKLKIEEVVVTTAAEEQPKKKKEKAAIADTALATPTPPVVDEEQPVKGKKVKTDQSATAKVTTKKRKVGVTVEGTTVDAINGSESGEKKTKKKKKKPLD